MGSGCSEEDARAAYEDCKRELEAIINDLTAEQAVADAAEAALRDLARDFAIAAWNTIEARTANLVVISDRLALVIRTAGQDPAAEALDRVTGVSAGLAQIVARIRVLTA
jgi:hypothetical protein